MLLVVGCDSVEVDTTRTVLDLLIPVILRKIFRNYFNHWNRHHFCKYAWQSPVFIVCCVRPETAAESRLLPFPAIFI